MEGSYWFQRFVKYAKTLNSEIRVKRINFGFYRIYYRNFYLGECYKEMPQYGHDIYEKNLRLMSDKKYYEQFEDRIEKIRKIKNFVEGYWESVDKLRTRFYLLKHNDEFNKTSSEGYGNMKIK